MKKMAKIIAVFGVFTLLITVAICGNVSVWIENSPAKLVYQVLPEGTNLNVTCKARPAVASISWFKYTSMDRIAVKNADERIYIKGVASGMISLNIINLTKADSAVFQCISEYDGANSSALLNVTVDDSNFCGFENGLGVCSFFDAKGGSPDWNMTGDAGSLAPLKYGNGQIVQERMNRLTGPSYDITLGPQYHNGRYLYLESGKKHLRRSGMLVSFLFERTATERCFTLWYHAWGPNVGKVIVSRLLEGASIASRTNLNSISGSQGNVWKLMKVPVPPVLTSYRLVIELQKNSGGDLGDIAIDNVRWFDSPCSDAKIPDNWDKLKTPIRLVNGTKEREGRVEVYHEGEWGTVSGATNDKAAEIICKALGYNEKKSTLKRNLIFGEGRHLRVWVGGLNCSGTERDPMACRVGRFDQAKHADHVSDIGVVCEDECIPQPCGSKGDCVNTASGFECRCNFGYEGDACQNRTETEIILKDTEREDNAKRVDVRYRNKWETLCPARWTSAEATVVCSMNGFNDSNSTAFTEKVTNLEFNTTGFMIHCKGTEKDLVECTTIPVPDGYDCSRKYAGVICNDYCSSSPCLNGGNCTNSENGFNCTCPSGIFGPTCNKDKVDDCVNNKCVGGATCLDGVGNYTCQCPPRKSGRYCRFTVSACTSNPCKNGKLCQPKGDNSEEFECQCGPNWKGVDCSIDVDECEGNPCPSNKTCSNEAGTYHCICPMGLTPAECQNTTGPQNKKCPKMPDIAHGTVTRYKAYVKYSCDKGYAMDVIPTKECGNDGNWIPNNDSPRCLPVAEADDSKFTAQVLVLYPHWKGQYIYNRASFDFHFNVMDFNRTFFGTIIGYFRDNLVSRVELKGSLRPPSLIKLKVAKKSGSVRYDHPDWTLEGNFTYVKREWHCRGVIHSPGFGHFYMVPEHSNSVLPLSENDFQPLPAEPKKSNKKTVAIVLTLLFLILALTVCGIVYYMYRNGRHRNRYQGATRFENPLYEQ